MVNFRVALDDYDLNDLIYLSNRYTGANNKE